MFWKSLIYELLRWEKFATRPKACWFRMKRSDVLELLSLSVSISNCDSQWFSMILRDSQRISMNLNENPRKILKASKIVLSFQLSSSGLDSRLWREKWLSITDSFAFIEDFYVWSSLKLNHWRSQRLNFRVWSSTLKVRPKNDYRNDGLDGREIRGNHEASLPVSQITEQSDHCNGKWWAASPGDYSMGWAYGISQYTGRFQLLLDAIH